MFFILQSCFTFVTTNKEINISHFKKLRLWKLQTLKQPNKPNLQQHNKLEKTRINIYKHFKTLQTMKNLFNIDAELYEVYSAIENNGGEMTPELEAALEISESERLSKGEGYVYVIKQLKSQAELIKSEIKRLQDIAKRYETSAEKLSDTLLQSVIAHGQIKTAFVTISSRKSKSVSITDENAIPSEFMRIKYEPNKTALKEALEAGQLIDGALIVENVSLNIR